MFSEWVLQLLGVAVFIWLVVLSVLFWKEYSLLSNFFPKSGERDIRKKFEELLETVGGFKAQAYLLDKKLIELDQNGLKHIQRVELLRYNPYQDTGGDQSFSVALLDNKGNGIVITSLHSRSGTRVFAKPVSMGKGNKHELSEEEEQVIKKALG